MTASSPRPAGSEPDSSSLYVEQEWGPECTCPDSNWATHRHYLGAQAPRPWSRPVAPDTTGGELREAIRQLNDVHGERYVWERKSWGDGSRLVGCICGWDGTATAEHRIDAILALPALRDLLAERDKLAAQVQAVEGVRDFIDACAVGIAPTHARIYLDLSRRLTSALGTPTTGGGE